MKTQKLSHSISKFTPSLAIALLVAFAPYTSALPSSQYGKLRGGNYTEPRLEEPKNQGEQQHGGYIEENTGTSRAVGP